MWENILYLDISNISWLIMRCALYTNRSHEIRSVNLDVKIWCDYRKCLQGWKLKVTWDHQDTVFIPSERCFVIRWTGLLYLWVVILLWLMVVSFQMRSCCLSLLIFAKLGETVTQSIKSHFYFCMITKARVPVLIKYFWFCCLASYFKSK